MVKLGIGKALVCCDHVKRGEKVSEPEFQARPSNWPRIKRGLVRAYAACLQTIWASAYYQTDASYIRLEYSQSGYERGREDGEQFTTRHAGRTER